MEKKTQIDHIAGSHLLFETNLQWLHRTRQGGNRSQVTLKLFRDLKPANIMLSKGVVKIGDFGFAKKNITKRMKNATSVGTPLYMPLEILKS